MSVNVEPTSEIKFCNKIMKKKEQNLYNDG